MSKFKQDKSADAQVKARVLLDCAHGRCNEVVSLPADEVAAGERAGQLDSNPAAVAYAQSLKG